MRRFVIVLALVATVVAPAAHAGGWATVVLAPPPADLHADAVWTARLTVLRHGVTPTEGAAPWVTIRSADYGAKAFPAKPAGETGVYVASVVFPEPGSWRYEVSDGLAATGGGASQTHTYAPVAIVAGAAGGGGVDLPVWPFVLVALALVTAFAFARVRQRGRRPAPQS